MLKQYHLTKKIFADPILLTNDSGEPILSSPPSTSAGELQYTTSGNGWFAVETQEEIDSISASITGGGEVWEENGKLCYSGRCPSDNHKWDSDKKKWLKLTKAETQEKLTALFAAKRDNLIEQIDNRAATIYNQWTRFESEYRERKATAEAYKSANYQGECSRYITDFAERAGIDNKTATDLILAQAAGLEKLQVELANQRMRKYELKAPNLTLEQIQATFDDIIKQMDGLMEAYKNG